MGYMGEMNDSKNIHYRLQHDLFLQDMDESEFDYFSYFRRDVSSTLNNGVSNLKTRKRKQWKKKSQKKKSNHDNYNKRNKDFHIPKENNSQSQFVVAILFCMQAFMA